MTALSVLSRSSHPAMMLAVVGFVVIQLLLCLSSSSPTPFATAQQEDQQVIILRCGPRGTNQNIQAPTAVAVFDDPRAALNSTEPCDLYIGPGVNVNFIQIGSDIAPRVLRSLVMEDCDVKRIQVVAHVFTAYDNNHGFAFDEKAKVVLTNVRVTEPTVEELAVNVAIVTVYVHGEVADPAKASEGFLPTVLSEFRVEDCTFNSVSRPWFTVPVNFGGVPTTDGSPVWRKLRTKSVVLQRNTFNSNRGVWQLRHVEIIYSGGPAADGALEEEKKEVVVLVEGNKMNVNMPKCAVMTTSPTYCFSSRQLMILIRDIRITSSSSSSSAVVAGGVVGGASVKVSKNEVKYTERSAAGFKLLLIGGIACHDGTNCDISVTENTAEATVGALPSLYKATGADAKEKNAQSAMTYTFMRRNTGFVVEHSSLCMPTTTTTAASGDPCCCAGARTADGEENKTTKKKRQLIFSKNHITFTGGEAVQGIQIRNIVNGSDAFLTENTIHIACAGDEAYDCGGIKLSDEGIEGENLGSFPLSFTTQIVLSKNELRLSLVRTKDAKIESSDGTFRLESLVCGMYGIGVEFVANTPLLLMSENDVTLTIKSVPVSYTLFGAFSLLNGAYMDNVGTMRIIHNNVSLNGAAHASFVFAADGGMRQNLDALEVTGNIATFRVSFLHAGLMDNFLISAALKDSFMAMRYQMLAVIRFNPVNVRIMDNSLAVLLPDVTDSGQALMGMLAISDLLGTSATRAVRVTGNTLICEAPATATAAGASEEEEHENALRVSAVTAFVVLGPIDYSIRTNAVQDVLVSHNVVETFSAQTVLLQLSSILIRKSPVRVLSNIVKSHPVYATSMSTLWAYYLSTYVQRSDPEARPTVSLRWKEFPSVQRLVAVGDMPGAVYDFEICNNTMDYVAGKATAKYLASPELYAASSVVLVCAPNNVTSPCMLAASNVSNNRQRVRTHQGSSAAAVAAAKNVTVFAVHSPAQVPTEGPVGIFDNEIVCGAEEVMMAAAAASSSSSSTSDSGGGGVTGLCSIAMLGTDGSFSSDNNVKKNGGDDLFSSTRRGIPAMTLRGNIVRAFRNTRAVAGVSIIANQAVPKSLILDKNILQNTGITRRTLPSSSSAAGKTMQDIQPLATLVSVDVRESALPGPFSILLRDNELSLGFQQEIKSTSVVISANQTLQEWSVMYAANQLAPSNTLLNISGCNIISLFSGGGNDEVALVAVTRSFLTSPRGTSSQQQASAGGGASLSVSSFANIVEDGNGIDEQGCISKFRDPKNISTTSSSPAPPPTVSQQFSVGSNAAQATSMAAVTVSAAVVPAMSFSVARQQAMLDFVQAVKDGDCSGIMNNGEEVPLANSPTQISIGGPTSVARMYVGGVVGNTVLLVGVFVLCQVLATVYMKKTASSSWNRPYAVFARCYVALGLFVIMSLLFAPTLTFTLVTLAVGESVSVGMKVLVAIFGLAFGSATVFYAVWSYFVRDRSFEKYQMVKLTKAELAKRSTVRKWIAYWFDGPGEWIMSAKASEKAHLDFDAANPVLDGFNDRAPWFALAEYCVQIGLALAAFLAQVVPVEKSCVTQCIVLLISLGAHLMLCLYFRPFQEKFNRIFLPIGSALEMIVIVVAYSQKQDSPSWIESLALAVVSLQSATAGIVVLASLGPLMKPMMRAVQKLRSGARRAANKQHRSSAATVPHSSPSRGSSGDGGRRSQRQSSCSRIQFSYEGTSNLRQLLESDDDEEQEENGRRRRGGAGDDDTVELLPTSPPHRQQERRSQTDATPRAGGPLSSLWSKRPTSLTHPQAQVALLSSPRRHQTSPPKTSSSSSPAMSPQQQHRLLEPPLQPSSSPRSRHRPSSVALKTETNTRANKSAQRAPPPLSSPRSRRLDEKTVPIPNDDVRHHLDHRAGKSSSSLSSRRHQPRHPVSEGEERSVKTDRRPTSAGSPAQYSPRR